MQSRPIGKLKEAVAYWQYTPPKADEALGFDEDDYAREDFEVWPENWPSWEMWCELGGQWRTSAAGISSLDYSVFFGWAQMHQIPRLKKIEMFADLRCMEAATLNAKPKS